MLFAEAARVLGFGARIVSGYLYNPDQQSAGSAGAGSTHAWAEVFVPGAGWISFDPTNDLVVSDSHITLAWGRDYGDVTPVKGITLGATKG